MGIRGNFNFLFCALLEKKMLYSVLLYCVVSFKMQAGHEVQSQHTKGMCLLQLKGFHCVRGGSACPPPSLLRGPTPFHRRMHFPASEEAAAAEATRVRPAPPGSQPGTSGRLKLEGAVSRGPPRPLPVHTSATCPIPPFLPTRCHPRSSGLGLEQLPLEMQRVQPLQPRV